MASMDKEDMVKDGAVTLAEACRITGLSRSTLHRAMSAGRLAYLKHGRARRIPRRALVAFQAAALVGNGAGAED